MLQFGYKYIDKHLKSLVKHINSALHERDDIENIHQARVACRRLQAAMDLIGDVFNPGEVSRWKKQIRKLIKALSPPRDRDVFIDSIRLRLRELTPEQKAFRAGIKRLLLRNRQERDQLDREVKKAIRRIEKSRIITEIGAAVSRNIWNTRLYPEQNRHADLPYRCSQRIRVKLQKLYSFESSLDREDDIESHHKMRIAAKHLRYAMEICRDLFDGRLDKYIKCCKRLQTLAGDLHDCDVWGDTIREFPESEHKRAIEFYGYDRQSKRIEPGISYLAAYYAEKRKETFQDLRRYWKELNDQFFREQLTELLLSVRPDEIPDAPEPSIRERLPEMLKTEIEAVHGD